MNDATTILRAPASLVANVPYLIGFHPVDSVVGVWLKDKAIMLTQRVDMDPALNNPLEFISPVVKHEPDELIVLVYGDASKTEVQEFVSTIALGGFDFTIRDALWVRDNHWGSFMCNDPECCPPEGTEIEVGLGAELAYLGVSPQVDREALRAELKPTGEVRMSPLRKTKVEKWRDDSIAKFADIVDRWGRAYDPTCAKVLREVGRSLHDIRVRDTILWDINQMSPEDRTTASEVVKCVCRTMHPDDAAPACTVAAVCCWTEGDGARANIAVEYSEVADPEYSLAELVAVSLSSGLPPAAWKDSMKGLSRDDVRYGVNR